MAINYIKGVCDKCGRNKNNNNHCDKCCFYSTYATHCCDCRMNYDKKHCCNCIMNYDEKHCCKCEINYDKKHCCDCQMKYDNNHCCKCEMNYDKKHCCNCGMNYNNNHCCVCKIDYDLPVGYEHCCGCKNQYKKIQHMKHCCVCCSQYNDNVLHCIDCHCVVDNINTFHCKKCHTIYGITETHCCTCNGKRNSYMNHCCNCGINYDSKNENHCCNCENNFSNDYENKTDGNFCVHIHNYEDVCFKCKIIYNKNKIHCCECHDAYEKDVKHCCQCKKIYEQNQEHCSICHLTINTNEKHCCKCSKANINEKHCKICCNEITSENHNCCNCGIVCDENYNLKHCRKCHMEYEINNYHCCKCAVQWDKTQLHCCKCNTIHYAKEKCKCYNLTDLIIKLANDECAKQINSNRKAVLSPCLSHFNEFPAQKRYFAGMNSINTNLADEIHKKNHIIVYHGTPSLDCALNICHNGWNIAMRGKQGQAFGKGEYFSETLEIADYFGEKGAVIVSIIVNPNKISSRHDYGSKNGTHHMGKMIRVIENTEQFLFVFPICIIETHAYIRTITCSYDNSTSNYQNISTVYFYDSGWKEYDKKSSKFVIEQKNAGIFVFNMTINKMNYNINMHSMTQTNSGTNVTRNIMIE